MEPPSGLSQEEAKRRLTTHGPNELTQKGTQSPWVIFFAQFKSILVVLLLIATITSLVLGDTVEGILILAIVILNAILGFVQEYRAEKAIAALKSMTVSIVRVMRGGQTHEINSRHLVPGDIVLLEEGNKVPADGKVRQSVHLEINEAALTGESLPVAKSPTEKEEQFVFMGTIVARGRGVIEITATGMNTKFGKIAAKLATIEKEETQLEKKLAGVAKQLGVLAAFAAGGIALFGYLHHSSFIEVVLTAISMAVAAVPEGLPAVITITLAVGTQRMARQKAILRKLAAIEALGSITVIATDKTGTITKNEMHVVSIWIHNTVIKPSEIAGKKLSQPLEKLLKIASRNNNASLAPRRGDGGYDIIGDQTEGALLRLAKTIHPEPDRLRQTGKFIEEFAFDPTRKIMSVVWHGESGLRVLTKGAPESILDRSTRMATKRGEKTLTEKDREMIIDGYEAFAREGLRVIAIASKKIPSWHGQTRDHAESNLTFVGFVGIADPPRDEVADAIGLTKQAGIRTVMITGDNELTGYAIAKQIGLIESGDEVISGVQLASLSDEELMEKLPFLRVAARVTPEQKLRIVSLLKAQGEIVAVTGDGVNDALALKQSDVGVAMGKTGTDVAREAADMVITDDNFATLVAAIAEGRVIYDNMKASIKYLIGCNVGEVLALLGGSLLGWPFILTPLHLLYVNLVTDGLPAIALALTPRHPGVMERKPRREKDIFTKFDYRWFIEVSILTAITTLFAYFIGNQVSPALGRTLAFTIVILAQQLIFLDVAAFDRSMFSRHARKNAWIILPFLTFTIQLIIISLPSLSGILKTTPPPSTLLLTAIAGSLVMILISELRKLTARRFFYGS